ncbi:MAG TPA: hypothetical protein VKH44_09720 [Pirellulaceae bacterium]|nr:hypothetical protein [Pirellulaceae bacterium]
MRICNLGDGLGQLAHAMSDLNERWAETREHWSDETSQDFEQTYLHLIPGQVQMLVNAVQTLAAIAEKAARELDDRNESI